MSKHRLGAVGVASLVVVGALGWVACNDPRQNWLGWFGETHWHGPRSGNEVALTFDDGPDVGWSLEVADILEAHGAMGTFFQVGKAVAAAPEVTRSLHARGHLLGNHGFHHDYWRWLDPRYPELERTQAVFERELDLCPALFRPPHGQRTPFMLRKVESAGMRTVTWDVSAADWTSMDGERVAQRVLDRVKPGSIILLHDGLDGEMQANRSVLRTALPRVLDGLEAKGLRPVRLDQLLDLPAYLPDC